MKTPRLKFYGIELTLDQLTRFLLFTHGPRFSITGWCGLYEGWNKHLERPFELCNKPESVQEFIDLGLVTYLKQDPVKQFYIFQLTSKGVHYIRHVVINNKRILQGDSWGWQRRQRKREKAQARKAARAQAEHPAPSV